MNNRIKRLFSVATLRAFMAAVFVTWTMGAMAAGDTTQLLSANNDIGNQASLQRGARNYVNYCMGCHSLQYMRYNQLAKGLGISEDQLIDNLMFTADRPTDMMTIAMPPADAATWFGRTPPDLTLIGRSRGSDYLYTFLKSFYVEEGVPTGVNNLVLANLSMPHVLWELQGLQKAVFEDVANEDGTTTHAFRRFEQITGGILTEDEYNQFVRDTVNFLEYAGEPSQLERRRLGVLVIAFLLVFGLFSYYLKKEFWKDIK